MLGQELPRSGVTEEPRDVDEDRVEKSLKFLRMYLEIIDVIRIFARADRDHPLLNASLEARRLVASEVEAATALQVVDRELRGRRACAMTFGAWARVRRRTSQYEPRASTLVGVRQLWPALSESRSATTPGRSSAFPMRDKLCAEDSASLRASDCTISSATGDRFASFSSKDGRRSNFTT